MQWQDLSVVVKKKGVPKTILAPTTGMLNSGDVLAIMGPSGSGKTLPHHTRGEHFVAESHA